MAPQFEYDMVCSLYDLHFYGIYVAHFCGSFLKFLKFKITITLGIEDCKDAFMRTVRLQYIVLSRKNNTDMH